MRASPPLRTVAHAPVLQGRGSGIAPGCLNPAPPPPAMDVCRAEYLGHILGFTMDVGVSLIDDHRPSNNRGSRGRCPRLPLGPSAFFAGRDPQLLGGRSGVGQTVWRIVPNSPHFDVILSKKSKTLKLLLLRLGVYWDVGIQPDWERNRLALAWSG